MGKHSITGTESFRLRAQHSEFHRIVLTLGVLAAVLTLTVVRRLVGGLVMSDNRVFFLASTILAVAIVYETCIALTVHRANRIARLINEGMWRLNAAIELAVPVGLLTVSACYSPRGNVAALSAPPLLLIPIIILMSVLRLKPLLTLWIGLAAAGAHAALVVYAIYDDAPAANTHPVMFSYSVLIAAAGIGGSIVARRVKGYVRQAIEEAFASEEARARVASMEHDLNIARDIQRGLIPTSAPDLKSFDMAGMSRPADLTGGDYYDWQVLPDGRVAVVIADVTGHGIGPAMVMAVCRAYARATTPLTPTLGELLERLNVMIHSDVQGTRFITFAVAVIDPKASCINILSAGHGPTLFYCAANRSVTPYHGNGCPLGVLAAEQYTPEQTLEMAPGDILLLTTDGFFECQHEADNELFGIERIEVLLKQHADKGAAALLAEIDKAVLAYAGNTKQVDDMTAVAIKRR